MTKKFLCRFTPFKVASVLMCLAVLVCMSSVSADVATYEYDRLGRLIKVIYGDGPQFYYYYDKAGNRIEKQVTAPKSCGDVVRTNYTFTDDWTCGGGYGLVVGGGGTSIDGSGHTVSDPPCEAGSASLPDEEARQMEVTPPMAQAPAPESDTVNIDGGSVTVPVSPPEHVYKAGTTHEDVKDIAAETGPSKINTVRKKAGNSSRHRERKSPEYRLWRDHFRR